MEIIVVIIVIAVLALIFSNAKREWRRDYYRNDYLKSDAWQRKRYVVFKRDTR